jgi:hypothetical protein
MNAILDTNLLINEINKFHFELAGGKSFWAPYLANFNNTQDPNVPRGLGKASPEEIKKSVDYIVGLFPDATAEEIKQKLVDGSLPEKEFNYKGIDCSGFVYYVMSAVYQKVLGKELIDDLSVPKDNVLNGAFNFDEWKDAYTLSEKEADELPEDVPVRWVVETFKRKPVNLCRVAGLVSDFSSRPVCTSEMKLGDLVDLAGSGDYKFHVAIVCNIEGNIVTIVHSTRDNVDDPGGIRFEKLPFDSEKILTENMHYPCGFNGVRRLKSL